PLGSSLSFSTTRRPPRSPLFPYTTLFRSKIEMRQIGARQESARIGGLGSCGRELCCSTWLSDFKSVNTHAARYQNLSINQAKLSDRKSTRLNSSHVKISYAVFCLKKKKN